jgi:hypothetical protein
LPTAQRDALVSVYTCKIYVLRDLAMAAINNVIAAIYNSDVATTVSSPLFHFEDGWRVLKHDPGYIHSTPYPLRGVTTSAHTRSRHKHLNWKTNEKDVLNETYTSDRLGWRQHS